MEQCLPCIIWCSVTRVTSCARCSWPPIDALHLRNLSFHLPPASTLYPDKSACCPPQGHLYSHNHPCLFYMWLPLSWMLVFLFWTSATIWLNIQFLWKIFLDEPYHILFAHLSCICPWHFCGLGIHMPYKTCILNVWKSFYKSVGTLRVNHNSSKAGTLSFISPVCRLGGTWYYVHRRLPT